MIFSENRFPLFRIMLWTAILRTILRSDPWADTAVRELRAFFAVFHLRSIY